METGGYMKRKLSYLTIIMIFGIINMYYLNNSYTHKAWLLICILLPLIVVLTRKKLNKLSLGMVIYLLGAFLVFINIEGSGLYKFIGEEILLEGLVLEKKEIDKGVNNFIVKSQKICYQDKELLIKEKTRIKIIGDLEVDLGDRIKFKTRLREPMKNTNPKLYNFKRNLQSEKVYTTSTIKKHDVFEHNRNKSLLFEMKNKFRERIIDLFQSGLSKDNSFLMISVILGDPTYLSDKDISSYRTLGLAHVLAVSGLHIGIVAGFSMFLLSNLGIRRKYSTFIVLLMIWSYSFLIGFPVSTLRACLMLSFTLLAKLCVEPYDSINNLFLSMLILLIINPLYIFNLGFQLSYAASLSLLLITPYLQELFYPMKIKVMEYILPILSVQLGLAPIQLYYFNEISIFAILSNLLIVPIVSLALVIGFIMVVFSFIFPLVNPILALLLDIILTGEKTITDLFLRLDILSMKLRSPDLWEVLVYYLLLLIVVGIIDISKLSKRLQKMIVIWSGVFLLGINILPVLDKSLYLEFIDVGQGDSILIRNGIDNYLVDTGGEVLGNFKVGENITLPYLRKHGYDRIRGLFISHFHEDHSKAAPLLIEELKVDNILASYVDEENEICRKIRKLARRVDLLEEGNELKLGRGLNVIVLSPNEDMISNDYSENNKSLVLLLEYLEYRILLTGDMEKEIENYFIQEKNLKDIDIIKVAHHGSRTSSTEEFLDLINPEIGVISVGRNNLFGHPEDEVIKRYEKLSTKIYRTDEDGLIKIKINKKGVEVDPYLEEVDIGPSDILVYLICLINAYIIILIYKKDRERFLIGL